MTPDDVRALCRLDDIADGDAKGFEGEEGSFIGLLAVRQGDRVYVYQNACPHIGTPLDWTPDRFLTVDRRHLICATHGAQFTIDTGECISGPCRAISCNRSTRRSAMVSSSSRAKCNERIELRSAASTPRRARSAPAGTVTANKTAFGPALIQINDGSPSSVDPAVQ